MGPTEAVTSVYRQYAGFAGRASRSEYWWFTLFSVIVSWTLLLIIVPLGAFGVLLLFVFDIGSILPSMAVTVRRLHDIGRSGWFVLVVFIPLVGVLVLIYFTLLPSQRGANRFGPQPAPMGPA